MLNLAEAARRLGITPQAVRKRIEKIRRKDSENDELRAEVAELKSKLNEVTKMGLFAYPPEKVHSKFNSQSLSIYH